MPNDPVSSGGSHRRRPSVTAFYGLGSTEEHGSTDHTEKKKARSPTKVIPSEADRYVVLSWPRIPDRLFRGLRPRPTNLLTKL